MPSRYNRYYDVCRMSGSFCSHSSDCIGILNGSSFYLPGSSFRDDRATQTAIQKMKSCSDFFASECLDLLQKAVDWSISFAAGSDARKTAFLQDISQGKDKEFLRDVLNTYRSNHESADLRGRCGYSIGSREYLNYVERKVLLVTGAALDALELYQTVESDLHDADRKIGKKTYSAVAGIGGSWGLGALGAKGALLQVLQSEQRLCLAWERQSAVLLVVLYSVLQGPTAVMHLADGLLILLQWSDVNVMETGKS